MVRTLEVISVKGSCRWAIQATIRLGDGTELVRFRGYHYKKEAIANFPEWAEMPVVHFYPRNFNHNFHTAEEVGITTIGKGVKDE